MPHQSSRPLILTIAICLALIIMSSVLYRLSENVLVKIPTPAEPVEMSAALTQMGMSQEVASLVQTLQTNPDDPVTLLSLVEVYLRQSDFSGAQDYVNRALMAAPSAPEPQYYQGIIQAQLGQNTEAAESLERALKLADTASTRFSLGILYLYSLDEKEKGITHLKAALTLPDVTPDMRALIADELKKAGESVPETPAEVPAAAPTEAAEQTPASPEAAPAENAQ